MVFDDKIFAAELPEWDINRNEARTTQWEVFCLDKLWYVGARGW